MGLDPLTVMMGASIASSAFGANSANKSADANVSAANQANETNRYIYDNNIKLSEPWRTTGVNALDALSYEAGIGPKPAAGFQGFQQSPGYQFNLDQGNQAMERMAAARGLRLSGGTLKEGAKFASGLASQDYGNWWNRMAGLAGAGQAAAGQQANAGTNYANAFGQNVTNAGNARASGYAGVNDAMQGGINNAFSGFGMAQSGMFGANPGFGINPSPTGLKAWGFNSSPVSGV